MKQEGVEAYKWLELAKQGNDLDEVAATELQTQLVAHMTPEQIAEGQKLASEFVPTVFGSWGIKPLISYKKSKSLAFVFLKNVFVSHQKGGFSMTL